MRCKRITLLIIGSWFFVFGPASFVYANLKTVNIVIPNDVRPRVAFGVDSLANTFRSLGYQVKIGRANKLIDTSSYQLVIGKIGDSLLNSARSRLPIIPKEGYIIQLGAQAKNFLVASDDTGLLYGCLALVEKCRQEKEIPNTLQYSDHPEMVLRGTAIGIQKTHYLPGRTVYEYPYTPEEFPWLYDKKQWITYLDMLLENRYNSLYLWNGHPFASLVRLKDYPYAVEVDEETFKKNEEMFRFVTEEADKRGIWIIQMFYNIIISKPFAEKHGLATQDRNRPILPIIADYTRKSIAAFVEKYPNVGLLITLGEAMEGVGQDDIDWFTKTIIPGVQEGLKKTSVTSEPPIVLRAHDTDAPAVMKAALPLYKNLYTMAKYNGEALTTYTPRGKWAALHRTLSDAAPVHIQNVHILANLEPFRYSSPDFIQKSVRAMHDVYHSNGLHLYPQASYWDWPYTADQLDKGGSQRLLQVDRDWMWYKAWARYAWKADRKKTDEENYWSALLADKFGTSTESGEKMLNAYEEMGEIAPKLLRRYGITDGNRQTLSLGMFMTQLINPYRYSLFTMLYESEAPEGEMIIEYAKKEWENEAHIGETPIQVAKEVVEHGEKAVKAIQEIKVKKDEDEFNRIKNDVYCYDALAKFYAQKAHAAVCVLKYKYSNDMADLLKALPYLESSVNHFRRLTELTESTYLYANSMQTKQRKIPIRGIDGNYKKWNELLPLYEQELDHFKKKIDSLQHSPIKSNTAIIPLKAATVKLESSNGYYSLAMDAEPFINQHEKINGLAGDLIGLKGIKVNGEKQLKEGSLLHFTTDRPVRLLVGFFKEKEAAFGAEKKDKLYAPEPDLEHDASANDFGQSDVFIANALQLENHPNVHIHAYAFEKGEHRLTIPKGKCLLLGFIDGKQSFKNYDAGIGVPPEEKNIDWLFE
ncbi:alpha-d-galacturonidase [Olivibacter domesticus]|uniref:Glycosyl hydrolase family 20, domain 2 n=1 Tax=Olivibacter domesticus TaxID=407022 RepID=A0A1H7TYQ8_OLID1|nr:hypothetical protein [Olivibacter domesticus]SEL89980.1 hypothetical protein SAMN05661044_03664 [Olivibacter domesticus]